MIKRDKEISKMADDIYNLISYDEWSAREYGEISVDTYCTAMNLYDAGYRKANDVRRETAKAILDYFDRYAGTGKYLIGNMISDQRKKYGLEED